MSGLVRWDTTHANRERVEPTQHRCRWWKRRHKPTLAAKVTTEDETFRIVFCQRCGYSWFDRKKLMQMTGYAER